MFVWRKALAGGLALALLSAAPAAAHVHTVAPGETLWEIAAVNGLSTSSVAAANGLSPDAHVRWGTNVTIPGGPATAPAGASAGTAGAGAPPPAGAYTVRPGDTLTGIAARAGVSPGAVAFMNGLSPTSQVIIGTVLKLPAGSTGAGAPVRATAARVVPQAPPTPTPGHVSAGEISTIAAQHGVPGSLAAAIAWQESGFNNGTVSAANARGVMQILPGTWTWVQQNLARHRLDPASPQENVHAGVLYLGQLLRDAGGDPATAIAGYYQGAGSVRSFGMLPETRRYVANVLALRSRFGG